MPNATFTDGKTSFTFIIKHIQVYIGLENIKIKTNLPDR